jgi:DNA-binding CsgD family transcriptional regulator
MRKLKRLATSGLPLEPYVRALFDVIHDAVPGGAHKPFFPDPANRPVALIQNFPAPYSAIMALRNYWLTSESTPQLSGLSIRFDSQTLKRGFLSKTVWPLEEFMTPQFYRSDGFNECARPLDHHHCICVSYYESGEAVGFYPLWRESDQPPFSREDTAFLNSSAPFVTHGLRVAQTIDHSVHADVGSSFFKSSPSWGSGVILLDSAGRVITADPTAISIFDNLALFNKANSIAFSSRLRDAFEYIARSLNAIFGDERHSDAQPPSVQFYSQWTGITLKLRGILTHGSQGERYFTVMVERGELVEHRRRRLMFRWGVSGREFEMLEALADRKPNHEIASKMRVTTGTFKSYLRRLADKLDVASVPELRAFAQTNFGS